MALRNFGDCFKCGRSVTDSNVLGMVEQNWPYWMDGKPVHYQCMESVLMEKQTTINSDYESFRNRFISEFVDKLSGISNPGVVSLRNRLRMWRDVESINKARSKS